MDAEKHRLSPDEHKRIFDEEIKPVLFAKASSVEKPAAIIFGGQPGAGKSAAVSAAEQELATRGGHVSIIGDDLRPYHPKYGELMQEDDKTAAFYTDKDSGRWVEMAIEHAKQTRANIVIEGTMRNPDVVRKTTNDLRDAGYYIDARLMAVNEKLSEQGILLRYEMQKADRGVGRMTTKEAHDAGYNGILKSAAVIESEKLADKITILRRPAEPIYTNELGKDGEWKKEPGARTAIEAERAKPMTLSQRQHYLDGFSLMQSMQAAPDRAATVEEKARVAVLKEQAQRMHQAAAYRELPKGEALKAYPQLAAAYAAENAAKLVTSTKMSNQDTNRFMQQFRDTLADKIERGEEVKQVRLNEQANVADWQRVVVANNSKTLERLDDNNRWAVQRVDTPSGLAKGVYPLYKAQQANKDPSAVYEGAIVHADKKAVYQLAGQGVIKHERAAFREKEPEIGRYESLQYRGDVVRDVAQDKGRSR